MTDDFDKYVNSYCEIINRVSKITGEKFDYFIKLRVDLMRKNVISTDKDKSLNLLDFGCGIGTSEIFLRESFPNAKIFGVDSSKESIKRAKSLQLDNVHFLTSESLELPFKENYFDLIYSNGTFHHITRNNHEMIFKQLFRTLRKGGSIFIFENNPYNLLVTRSMKKNPFDKNAEVVYPDYLITMLKKIGFHYKLLNYYFFFPRVLRCLRVTERFIRRFPLGAQYFVWVKK